MQVITIIKRALLFGLLLLLHVLHLITQLYKSIKASLRIRRSYNVQPPKSIAVILIMNESEGLWRRNKQLQWLIDSARNATSWCEKSGVQQLTIYEHTGGCLIHTFTHTLTLSRNPQKVLQRRPGRRPRRRHTAAFPTTDTQTSTKEPREDEQESSFSEGAVRRRGSRSIL